MKTGTRPGPVKEREATFQADFLGLLQTIATAASDRHELPAQEEPTALELVLNGPHPRSQCPSCSPTGPTASTSPAQ